MHGFLLSILYSLFCISKKNNQQLGFDSKIVFYSEKIKHDNTTIEKIMKINKITEKINLLRSTNLSIDDKLYEISNRNIPNTININNGGLYNDWNFEFFSR